MGRSPAVLFLLAMAVQSGIGAAEELNFNTVAANNLWTGTSAMTFSDVMSKLLKQDPSFVRRLLAYEYWKNSPYPGMAKRYAERQTNIFQSLIPIWDREQDKGTMSGFDAAVADFERGGVESAFL